MVTTEEEPKLARHRTLKGPVRWIFIAASAVAIAAAITYNFHTSFFGFRFTGNGYFYFLIMLYIPLVFLCFPSRKGASREKIPWYDFLCAILSFVSSGYLLEHSMEILTMGWEVQAPMLCNILSLILIILLLETARRTVGLVFMLICLFFCCYPLFAGHMPGFLMGNAFPFWHTVSYHSCGDASIVGLPMKVVGRILIGFMIFAVALQSTGAGKFFLNFALSVLGHVRGGAAKVSIIASALMGSVSGSVIANVLTTGSFTIPAMKRTGYPPHFAAAVEACASTGGVLMPPIMGVTAFVMCEMLGVSYLKIIAAAALPSILYYIGLFWQADSFAATHGLKGLPREECPSLKETMKEGWFYIFSIFLLIFIAVLMWRIAQAAWIAMATLLALTMIRKETRLTPKRFVKFIEDGGKFMAELTSILAVVGVIIGSLSVTGVAHSFAYEIISFAGGNVAFLLVLGAFASLVLGMGMTITACYIFLAIVMAPALIQMGFYPLGVHLFVMYWGMISFITPPVALGAFAASSVAGASAMKTGIQAMRLGIAIYFIPFFFVLNPALVLHGPVLDILGTFFSCAAGITIISGAMEGYLIGLGKLAWGSRAPLFAAGFLLGIPEWRTDILGLIIGGVTVGIILLLQKRSSKRNWRD